MARKCTICTNPQRGAIEAELAAGASMRSISRRYQVSTGALARHRECVPSPLPTSTHACLAEELVAHLRTRLGVDFGPQQRLEVGILRTIAAAVDADPTSVGLLREFWKVSRDMAAAYGGHEQADEDNPLTRLLQSIRIAK